MNVSNRSNGTRKRSADVNPRERRGSNAKKPKKNSVRKILFYRHCNLFHV